MQNGVAPDARPADQAEASSPADAPEAQGRDNWRFWAISGVFCLLTLLVIGRLVSYQVRALTSRADRGALALEHIPRGTVVDPQR